MQKLLDTWSNETPFSAQGLSDNDKSDAAKSFVLLEDNLKPLATSFTCLYEIYVGNLSIGNLIFVF